MQSDGARQVLLLVEDSAIIAMRVAADLDRAGYDVTHVLNGEDAVQACRDTQAIDLVLMDIDLGDGIDGTEAAQQILAFRDMPIVFLSSYTDPEVVNRTEGIGSYGYIVKDSGETVMLASIRMAFRLFAARSAERDQRERYQTLIEVASDAILTVAGPRGEIVEANAAARQMLGYSHEELMQLDGFAVVHPEETERTAAEWGRQVSERGQFLLRTRWIRKDGTGFPVEVSGRPIRFQGEDYVEMIARDVTAAEFAQTQIRETTERYQGVFDNALDALLLADDQMRYLDTNEAACELLGRSRDELLQLTVADVTPTANRAAAQAMWNGFIKEGSMQGLFELVRPDGETRHAEFRAVASVTPGVHLSALRDVTERVRAQEELERSQHFAHAIGDLVPILVFVYDLATKKNTWANRAHREFFASALADPEHAANPDILSILHPDDVGPLMQQYDALLNGRPEGQEPIEMRFRKNDAWVSFLVRQAVLQRDEEGSPVSFIGAMVDVTQLQDANRRVEAALDQHEVLLREMNHRVKNSLMVVSSLVSLYESELNVDLAEVRGQIDSISHVHGLLASEHQGATASLGDLVSLVLSSVLSSHSSISVRVDADDIEVQGSDAVPIGLIVNEIATNAAKHGFLEDGEGELGVSASLTDGTLTLRIANNGRPLKPTFDLRTTSNTGLQVVKALVQQMNGSLTVEREPVTTFVASVELSGESDDRPTSQ